MLKFNNNNELYKYFTEKVNVQKIPEEPLKMTLMGCKASLTTEINIINICPYLIPTENIPIIECPFYTIMRIDIDLEKFRNKKKKYKLYTSLIKAINANKDLTIFKYDYYGKKHKISRRGDISVNYEKKYLIYLCSSDYRRFQSEMKSQIQFSVYYGNKYYNVKRFTNGSIQIPHCLDIINFNDALEVTKILVDYENTHYSKYIYVSNGCSENQHDNNNCTCILRSKTEFNYDSWFTIILMNFRFVALNNWKIALNELNAVLLREKERLDKARKERNDQKIIDEEEYNRLSSKKLDKNSAKLPYIYYNQEDINISSVKYIVSNVRLTIKFYVPELKRKNNFITLTITSFGKFNLQGGLAHISIETFYNYILDLFRKNPQFFYREQPTDDEYAIIDSYEQQNNCVKLYELTDEDINNFI